MLGPLLFTAGGRIRTTNAAPTAFNGGVGSVQGLLSIVSSNPTHYHNGLGFVATGSLSMISGGTIAGYSNGLPVDSSGRVCAEITDPFYYSQGLPFSATGKLAINTPEAPSLGAFSSGFSEGFDI